MGLIPSCTLCCRQLDKLRLFLVDLQLNTCLQYPGYALLVKFVFDVFCSCIMLENKVTTTLYIALMYPSVNTYMMYISYINEFPLFHHCHRRSWRPRHTPVTSVCILMIDIGTWNRPGILNDLKINIYINIVWFFVVRCDDTVEPP